MEFLQTIEAKFRGIEMDEPTHTYYLNGNKMRKSVSSLLKRYYTPFDTDKQAPISAEKEGVTEEEIRKIWKEVNQESVTRGSIVHAFAERYALDNRIVPNSLFPQELAVKKFFDDLPPWIIVVAVEVKMYHHKHGFPGTMDLLLFDLKNNYFIIADYKTNKNLFKNYKGQTLLHPFTHLLDSPFNHYQLQLSYYQLLFEQTGYKVGRRLIIHLKLDGEYDMWETEDFTQQLILN